MIEKRIFYFVKCDCCKETLDEGSYTIVGTKEEIKETMEENDWHFVKAGKRQYDVLCDKCFDKKEDSNE